MCLIMLTILWQELALIGFLCTGPLFLYVNKYLYLGCEAEETFGLHHFLQHVALDAGRAVVFVRHAVLQVHIIHRQADVVFFAVNHGNGVEFVHHLCRANTLIRLVRTALSKIKSQVKNQLIIIM